MSWDPLLGPGGRRRADTARIAARYTQIRGRWFAVVAMLSTAIGAGEAFVLLILVDAAGSVARGSEKVSADLGPLSTGEVSTSTMLAIGAGVLVALTALNLASARISATLTARSENNARRILMRAFIRSSYAAQAAEDPARVQDVVGNHAYRVANTIQAGLSGLTAGASFVAFFVSAVILSPGPAVAIAIGGGAVALALRPLMRMTRVASSAHLQSAQEMLIRASEIVGSSREIAAFGVGSEFERDFDDRTTRSEMAARRVRFLARIQPTVFQYVAILLLLMGVALAATRDPEDVAGLAAVVLLLVRSLSYAQSINNAAQQVNEGRPYVEELHALVEKLKAEERNDAGVKGEIGAALDVRDVSFSYDQRRRVLDSISFRIEAGEFLGIVGPSGSGKSTLIQLLLRLREPTGGSITLGETDIRSLSRASWTAEVAYVPQDTSLLRASVIDNVKFGRPLGDDAVVNALQHVRLIDELDGLSDGLATVIGTDGVDLSGGQRQRLGIARALAGQPSTIVLDEPTSALDPLSEAAVRAALLRLRGIATVVVIAHRFSTVSMCDRLLVLADGRLEVIGATADVAESNGFVRSMVTMPSVRNDGSPVV